MNYFEHQTDSLRYCCGKYTNKRTYNAKSLVPIKKFDMIIG